MNDGYGNIDDELYGTEYTMANGSKIRLEKSPLTDVNDTDWNTFRIQLERGLDPEERKLPSRERAEGMLKSYANGEAGVLRMLLLLGDIAIQDGLDEEMLAWAIQELLGYNYVLDAPEHRRVKVEGLEVRGRVGDMPVGRSCATFFDLPDEIGEMIETTEVFESLPDLFWMMRHQSGPYLSELNSYDINRAIFLYSGGFYDFDNTLKQVVSRSTIFGIFRSVRDRAVRELHKIAGADGQSNA